jgi:hypothetical protein
MAEPPTLRSWIGRLGARKAKRINDMDDFQGIGHRAEHRTALGGGPAQGQGPRPIPLSEAGTPALDQRTDRRKSVIVEQYMPAVLDACRRGVSEVRIARSLGLNYRTWMRIRAEDERIASALAETRRLEEDELVALLMDKARSGETTALIFALKSRHNYRDQGAPLATAEQRVNVTINLPAAQPSIEAYVESIDTGAAG